jgi:hypothetical protein
VPCASAEFLHDDLAALSQIGDVSALDQVAIIAKDEKVKGVSKKFFFEKKNQKTSPRLICATGGRPGSNG